MTKQNPSFAVAHSAAASADAHLAAGSAVAQKTSGGLDIPVGAALTDAYSVISVPKSMVVSVSMQWLPRLHQQLHQ